MLKETQDVSRCGPSNNSKRSDGIWNEGSTTQSSRCGSRICVRGPSVILPPSRSRVAAAAKILGLKIEVGVAGQHPPDPPLSTTQEH